MKKKKWKKWLKLTIKFSLIATYIFYTIWSLMTTINCIINHEEWFHCFKELIISIKWLHNLMH